MAYTVILDAGHGGSDFGATYNGRKEKDHRKTVDAVAASLMLEGYLRSQSV